MLEILIKELCQFPNTTQLLSQLYNEMSKLALIRLDSLEKMNNQPDLVDDFFGLHRTTIELKPELFLTCPYLELFLKLSVMAIPIDHHDTSRGNLRFIKYVVKLVNTSEWAKLNQQIL